MFLTSAVTIHDFSSGKADAGTYIDSAMLGVGVGVLIFGVPVVFTGIAIYGLADYIFDLNGKADKFIGKDSGLWD